MKEKTLAENYRVLRELGSGSFGQTYLAKDTRLEHNNQCVIKHLKPSGQDEVTRREAKKRFPLEAKTLKKLGENHRQIPLLLDSFEEDGEFYFVQELVEGHDLEEEIKPGKRLEEAKVLNIVTEILDILTFVHSENIIHRDIKPSNIMRRKRDNKLVLIDFGTVKEIITQVSNVQNKTMCIGTKGYMPDEQIFGQPEPVSDLYALGMMAIFALTGVCPSKLAINSSTKEIEWRNLIEINSRLADVLDKMVRQEYRDRYSSAAEALRALKGVDLPPTNILPTPQPKPVVFKKAAAITSLLLILALWRLLFLAKTKNAFNSYLRKYRIWIRSQLS